MATYRSDQMHMQMIQHGNVSMSPSSSSSSSSSPSSSRALAHGLIYANYMQITGPSTAAHYRLGTFNPVGRDLIVIYCNCESYSVVQRLMVTAGPRGEVGGGPM